MADDQLGQLKHWQNLRTRAESGEIVLEAGVAEKLMGRCDTMLARLNEQVTQARDLQYVSGFGGLRSAQALAQKFANKAVADEDSAVNRINLSIEIVKLMRSTFELSAKNITEQDQQTSQTLGQEQP